MKTKNTKSKEASMKFEDHDYTPIEDIPCIEAKGAVVKVWCHNVILKDPVQRKASPAKFKAWSNAVFHDGDGNGICSTPFPLDVYLGLRKYRKSGLPVEVLAKVEKIEVKGGHINALEILQYRPGDAPKDKLQASRAEIDIVRRFVSKLHGEFENGPRWGLLEAIREAVVEEHGIVGVESDDLYSDTIDAMICQAFSGGMVNNSNGKINTCIIGPPSFGKKLFAKIAKSINIVSQEADAGATTRPGLTGAIKKGASPGKIPLASQGVFIMEDFDKSANKHELFSVLGDVMEDGRCVLSGAAKATHVAETAIHLDINRQSDLFLDAGRSRNVTSDVSLPSNIIARLDYVAEFRKDPALMDAKARQLIMTSGSNAERRGKIAEYCQANGIDTARFLKLIVAFVMSEFKEIDIGPVLAHMDSEFARISQENMKKMPELSIFTMRLGNSLIKFTMALTRIQLLDKSNQDAVDRALHLLSRKLDFLKCINPDYLVPRYRKTGPEAFQRWLFERYGPNEFSPNDVISAYGEDDCPCGGGSERTVRNWISKAADRKKNDVWKLKDIVFDRFTED